MRAGIIGCGNISETYFESQNLFNNFNVVACADINIEVAKQKYPVMVELVPLKDKEARFL